MPQPASTGLIEIALGVARRALGSKPPRVAAVQLGPMSGVDFKQTTGYDARQARAQRAQALADSLGENAWEQTRHQRYRDYREIAEEVPELARALEVYVDLIFGDDEAAYEVAFADTARPEVKRIISDTEAALALQTEIRKIMHEGLWLGDSFAEMVYGDAPMRLVAERAHRPEMVQVMQDGDGFLSHYELTVPGADKTRPLVPFQVIHYAPSAVRGARYGRSLFHSARYVRRHHDVFTDVTSMLCLKKASGDTYFLWPVPDNLDEQAVQDYIRELQQSVDTDVFFEPGGQLRRRAAASLDTVPKAMPYRVMLDDQGQVATDVKPTVVETKPADLRQMVEVLRYLQDRFFVATGVPKALVGLERDVNARATLEVQGLHFAISVRARQRDAGRILADIFTRALLVAGVTPIEGEFVIKMPDVSAFDEQLRAEVFQKRAAGVLSMTQAGVPLRQALAEGFGYDDDTLDQIMEAVGSSTVSATALVAAVERASKEGLRIVVEGTSRARLPENQPA